MKTVSLAKANKIRNKLKDKVLPALESKIAASRTFALVGYEETNEIVNIESAAIVVFHDQIELRKDVLNAISKLRHSISVTNHVNHVNELMASIDTLKKEIAFWKTVHAGVAGYKTPEQISAIMAYEKTLPADPYGRAKPSKVYPIEVDSTEERIAQLEADLQSLEEERNSKNYTITVSLDDELVKVLETFKLI